MSEDFKIKIDSKEITVPLIDKDDEKYGEISFNPSDNIFAQKFYELYGVLEKGVDDHKERGEILERKEIELKEIISRLEKEKKELEDGALKIDADEFERIDKEITDTERDLMDNVGDSLSLYNEFCVYVRKETDNLFGDGTSKVAFGNVMNLDVFIQLYNGIAPIFAKVREKKVAKYTKKARSKKRKRQRK